MGRGRTFLVRIDLAALTANLGREDRQQYPRQKVLRWLAEAGFKAVAPGHWTVEEQDLGHLQPSEVLHAELVDDAKSNP
jgi:hypothetical protein